MRYLLLLIACVTLIPGCGRQDENVVVLEEQPPTGEFTLTEISIKIHQADFVHALYLDDLEYKRIDFKKFNVDNQGDIQKQYDAIILENKYVKLTLLPKLGKPYSFIYKVTGNEEFFIPKVAHMHISPNKLGWWFMLGGVEYTMPDEEHGDTWATDWKWEITENSAKRKSVRLKVKELRFGLEEAIEISITPDKAYYVADLRITNPTDSVVHFQHWINPMWTPGGRGELTPNTEFIIPTKEVYATERSFNAWMLDYHPEGKRLQPYDENPMRYLKNWKGSGDLLAWKLDHGFYSAFSHEQNEGIVRVFPLEYTPGCNIWSWGAAPEAKVRFLFSGDSANAGYVEMWGGITQGFDKYVALLPGESIAWCEFMYPYHGTRGLHHATEDLAITFFKEGNTDYSVSICPSGDVSDCTLMVIDRASRDLVYAIQLRSAYPKKDQSAFSFKNPSRGDIEMILLKEGKEIARLEPKAL